MLLYVSWNAGMAVPHSGEGLFALAYFSEIPSELLRGARFRNEQLGCI
jgi:hypothetical protein